jgi:multidrug efflux pump subunit AcrA (membrane-fusion protein)
MAKTTIFRLSLAGVLLIAAGTLAVIWMAARPNPQLKAGGNGHEGGGEEDTSGGAIPVMVTHPIPDPTYSQTALIPYVTIEPYYRQDLEARVAGPVEKIDLAIGAHVKKNQELVKVWAPDLDAAVVQKQAAVAQREQELEVTKELVHTAEQEKKVKEAEVKAVSADLDYRNYYYDRISRLVKKGGIEPQLQDEAYKNKLAAESALEAAKVRVVRADFEIKDAEAKKVLAAKMVKVAEADLQVARALASFADLRAPFDATITHRNIDPGSFVQNATSGISKPLLTLERTDILTVVAKVPDNYVPYLTDQTEAIIEMTELPGIKIKGKVTRMADSIEASDRTMRIEVDLWNSDQAHKDYEKDPASADLKKGLPPLIPEFVGLDGKERPTLRPGMYGTMTLILRKFPNALLLPSQVLESSGGKDYIYLVSNIHEEQNAAGKTVKVGMAKRVPVILKGGNSGNNGKMVYLVLPDRLLTKNDTVVVSGKAELGGDPNGIKVTIQEQKEE